jgi:hypothetical protein
MESLVKSVLGNHIDGARLVEVIQVQYVDDGEDIVKFYDKQGRYIGEIRPPKMRE